MNKKELTDSYNQLMKTKEVYRLRCIVAIEDSDRAQKEADSLRTKLDKAESYVEQGSAMINAVMEQWYEYDVLPECKTGYIGDK